VKDGSFRPYHPDKRLRTAPQGLCCKHGITDGPKVFHSFRHSFIDALRLAGVPGEINIALVGHTDPTVNGKYGAKERQYAFATTSPMRLRA
jgi:integrase